MRALRARPGGARGQDRPGTGLALAALAFLLVPAGAQAQQPIPQGAGASDLEAFVGAPATPEPVEGPDPPRHPHMAPNGRSNLHNDAFQTDTYQGLGPLGRRVATTSTLRTADCASVTFDSRGRIVTVCVGVVSVQLELMDPRTLRTLASHALPSRMPGPNALTDFSGGGYFYLDDRDRAVVPTTNRHVMVIGQTPAPGFAVERDVDLTGVVADGDAILSALPDWSGRLWFVTRNGVVGTVAADGTIKAVPTGEGIGNSFAVDSDGSVSIVTNAALYRFEAAPDGTPRAVWREPYENTGERKPGQSQAGSGTTPTLIGPDRVAITDNADPMNVLVYQRGASATGERLVCKQPVFAPGASATDQSLIGTPELLVVENNHGYSGPAAVEGGRTTTPGLSRVDLAPSGRGCRLRWTSEEIAPSVVPKLSLAAGLVYTYTKPARDDGEDPWYLTAIDVHSGRTVFKALAGEGLGFNNHYAPVTLGPDRTAYVGALGGLIALRDRDAPPARPRPRPSVPRRSAKLRLSCPQRGRARARVTGRRIAEVRFAVSGRRGRRIDRRAPFLARLRVASGRRVVARVLFTGATPRVTRRARVPLCGTR